MKKLLLCIISGIALSASGQNNSSPKINEPKWFVGLEISPNNCFRNLNYKGGDDIIEGIVTSRNKREESILGLSSGLSVGYRVTKQISVSSGLYYESCGYQVKGLHITSPEDPEGLKNTTGISTHFRYLSIPVKVNYTFGKKKLQLITGLGIRTNILLGVKNVLVVKYDNGEKTRLAQDSPGDYNGINLSPILSLGLNYTMNSKWSFRMEPNFQIGLLPVADAPIKERLYNYGANVGCYYNL